MESRDGGSLCDDPAALIRTALRMAWRWCGSRADAEDIAQDAILRLLAQPRSPANVATWLFVVTRRLSHRYRLRARARSDAEVSFGASQTPTSDDRETMIEARTVLARLAQRDRVLLGYVIEGTTSKEIAAAFGCHVRDVGQMVSRARRKAKRMRDVRGAPLS